MPKRKQFSITGLLIMVGAVAATLAVGKAVTSSVIPRTKLAVIEIGSEKAKVLEVLGQPQEITNDHEWKYWSPFRFGWVEVLFDSNENVASINDESVF
jgi:hypothetical protein